MNYQAIRETAVEFMLNRDWKRKTAKRISFEQSLFDHTLIELDALITLLPLLGTTFVPALTEQEEQVLIASIIAHDVGKEPDEWQEYVLGRRGFLSDVNRELAEEVVPQLAELLGFTGIEEMLSSVLMHMRGERTDAKNVDRLLFGEHTNPRWKTLAELVDDVDNLCSAPGLFPALRHLEERSRLSNHLRTAYHLVQLRGVSTTLLHRAVIDAFVEKGWSPLLHYSNGTIYASSVTDDVSDATAKDVEVRLAEGISDAMGSDFANLVVTTDFRAAPLPKPDLFDYRELNRYLRTAARRANRANFSKKTESSRREVTGKYSLLVRNLKQLRGEASPAVGKSIKDTIAKSEKDWREGRRPNIDVKEIELQTARISTAQPEICMFKFFKAALSKDLLGSEVTPDAQEAYADFAEGSGKKKAVKVTPQTVARAEYDRVFGSDAYAALQSTSTLNPARDMALSVDYFWGLDGTRFGLQVKKLENLLDHEKREQILVNVLSDIADKVYAAVPKANRPIRTTPAQIAEYFMVDLAHPAPYLNLAEVVEEQLQAYAEAKPNARRGKGLHLCPICNVTFEGGTVAKADFLANPESHTNRAVSHGSAGYIVVCDTCKFERFLQQLLLGSKVSEIVILFPRMNIGHSSGEVLRRKATQIWDTALIRMSEANPNPDQQLSLSNTRNFARKLSTSGYDVFKLTPEEIVDLMAYRVGKDKREDYLKTLKEAIRQLFGLGEEDELNITGLNDAWATSFVTEENALDALIAGEVDDDDALRIANEATKARQTMKIVCQTPHMILIPITNPLDAGRSAFQNKVGKDWESDTNAGIRELYFTLVLGLSLDCSVAVIKAGEVITFEGGEGVSRVPPVPALRDLVGSEWVPIHTAKRWLDAIGAAALLANATAFPARSNLYAILKSPTAGHVLRRVEQKSDSGQAHAGHLNLLETIKEVLR